MSVCIIVFESINREKRQAHRVRKISVSASALPEVDEAVDNRDVGVADKRQGSLGAVNPQQFSLSITLRGNCEAG